MNRRKHWSGSGFSRDTKYRRAFALLLLAFVAVFNAVNLLEAYGSGAPYYSRTANMDKWVDPMPLLATVDLPTALLLFFAFRTLQRKR